MHLLKRFVMVVVLASVLFGAGCSNSEPTKGSPKEGGNPGAPNKEGMPTPPAIPAPPKK